MARLHADPITTALVHPTRRDLYAALGAVEEMSTVQLQKQVGVDRYNLYHHLKKMASLGLVENHRDVGRARWWRVATKVALPTLAGGEQAQSSPAPVTASPVSAAPALDTAGLPAELQQAIAEGKPIYIVPLNGSREQISAKKMLEALARENGMSLDLPFTFIPNGIALIGK